MGMFAEILAIGKFNQSIVNYLEYPEDFYKDTKDDVAVLVGLFGIREGSSLSREFAALLGLTDPWDFNQHKLDPKHFDKNGLNQWVNIYGDYKEDLKALFALADEEFEFYFLPNG